MRRILVQLALTAAVTGTAAAQDKSSEAPRSQPTDWSSWRWYLGTWTCTGPLAYGKVKYNATASVTHELVLDDVFLKGSLAIVETKDDPYFGGFRSMSFWTFDPTTKEMRYTAIDNQGSIEIGRGPGAWSGDKYEARAQLSGLDTPGEQQSQKKVTQSWKKISNREYRWNGTIGDPVVSEWDWTCKR
jgi:hypothetical protein